MSEIDDLSRELDEARKALGYLDELIADLSKANSYELTTTECRVLARVLAAAVLAAPENARLRKAIQEIMDFPYVGAQASQWIVTRARDALSSGQRGAD